MTAQPFPSDLTREELDEIEELAGLHFFPEEILFIVRPPQEIEPVERALRRGRLKMEAEVRRSVFQHAANGSSPAQTLAVQFIQQMRLYYASK